MRVLGDLPASAVAGYGPRELALVPERLVSFLVFVGLELVVFGPVRAWLLAVVWLEALHFEQAGCWLALRVRLLVAELEQDVLLDWELVGQVLLAGWVEPAAQVAEVEQGQLAWPQCSPFVEVE